MGLCGCMMVDRIFIERGVSGAKPIGQRPEGAKLLGILQAGDVVIAAKLDRLFRSALDALEVHAQFIKRGIGLHLIDLGGDIANGLSKLFYTIAVAFAEAEHDRIRERLLGTKADQKKRGRFLGRHSTLVPERSNRVCLHPSSPKRGTEGSNPVPSSGESVSRVPSMPTGAKTRLSPGV